MKKHKKLSIKKHLLLLAAVTVFLFSIIILSFAPKAHAIEPIYQVLTPKADCSSIVASAGAGANASKCFDGMGAVTARIWYDIMAVVNSLVLAALIWVAFMNILRIQLDSYAVKKILPTFIMAIILANFSFLIARMLLDVANIAISAFLTGNQANGVTGAFNTLISGPATGLFAPLKGAPAGPQNASTYGITNYAGYIMVYILKQIFVAVGAVMVAILAFIFLIRNYFIYFLICIAPAAFMALILPITKKYFQQWWSQFLKWIFMPVVSVFWLWLAGEFLAAIDPNSIWILPMAFAGVCLYMAITSPFKIGGAAVTAWGNWGKKAWGQTGGRATKWAGGEIKERAGYEALRARNAIARTGAYQRTLGDNSRIGRYRANLGAAKAYRKLSLEGPGLAKTKREEDSRVDAAFRLARDPRTPNELQSRYWSIIRKWSQDDKKSKETRGLVDLVDSLQRNADGTIVTSTNNQINPATGRPTIDVARFTGRNGLGDQASTLAQIAYLLRRPNTLDSDERRTAAEMNLGNPNINIYRNNAVVRTIPRLEYLNTTTGARQSDLRRIDANANTSSAVPMSQAGATNPSSGGPAASSGVPDFVAAVDRFTDAVEEMQHPGEAGGTGNFHPDTMAAKLSEVIQNLKPTGVGVGVTHVPEIILGRLAPQAKADLAMVEDASNRRAQQIRAKIDNANTDKLRTAIEKLPDLEAANNNHSLSEQGQNELSDTGRNLNIGGFNEHR